MARRLVGLNGNIATLHDLTVSQNHVRLDHRPGKRALGSGTGLCLGPPACGHGIAGAGCQHFLQFRHATRMVEMAMCNDNKLDILRVKAKRLDVLQQPIRVGTIQGVEQDMSVGRGDQPGGYPANPDIVDIVERLIWLDILGRRVAQELAEVRGHLARFSELDEVGHDGMRLALVGQNRRLGQYRRSQKAERCKAQDHSTKQHHGFPPQVNWTEMEPSGP